MYVSLIVRGVNLDPGDVTQILGHQPSKAFKNGDKFGKENENYRKFGGWFLYSSDDIAGSSIDEHLAFILGLITGSSGTISNLNGVEEVVIDVFLSINTTEEKSNIGDFKVSCSQLEKITENGADIIISYDSFVGESE